MNSVNDHRKRCPTGEEGCGRNLDFQDSVSGTMPYYPTSSPIVGNYSNWNGMYYGPQGTIPPHPAFPPHPTFPPHPAFMSWTWPQVCPIPNLQQHQQMHRCHDVSASGMCCQTHKRNEELGHIGAPGIANSTSAPAELEVTNLDEKIRPKDIPNILKKLFNDFKIQINNVSIFTHLDGSHGAKVQTTSVFEAEKAVAELKNHQLGNNRLNIKILMNHTTKERKVLSDIPVNVATDQVFDRYSSPMTDSSEIIFANPFYSDLPRPTDKHKQRRRQVWYGEGRQRGPDYAKWESKAILAYINYYKIYGSAHNVKIWKCFNDDGFLRYRTPESICSHYRLELMKNNKILNFKIPDDVLVEFLNRQDDESSVHCRQFYHRNFNV